MQIVKDVLFTKLEGVHLPKTNSGKERFELLVNTAEDLFTKSNFFDVSVSDICRAAHTAVGTFYIYFETKTDIYRYLVYWYRRQIKLNLYENIAKCTTRRQKEREGIKSFIKFSVEHPMLYNIIWGSLSVDKQLFEDYYVSFAKNYARALASDHEEINAEDVSTLAYSLMGISSFLGLKAIFEEMTEPQIDEMVDNALSSMLRNGIFKSNQ